ncbi:MAG: hypothetical protein ACYS5F_15620 [Planctomycetota bacterium]|jgi:hypothetical protein
MASWETGMKVDPVALASVGCYSETYGNAEQKNLCNLFASLGFIEDAVNISINIAAIMDYYLRRRKND